MGLRSKQDNLEQSRQQQTSWIEQLTEALEQSKADNKQLQQENSNLTDELAEVYKKIRALNNSDLELKKAQQLKQSAEEQIEISKQLMRDAEQQKQQNKQKEKELQTSRETLEKQQNQLKEKESSLQKTIEDVKKQAQDDAAAALADGWQKLEDSQKAAKKEQDDERQRIEALKKSAQREFESAQNAKKEAQERGYKESLNNYTMVIRLVIIFAGFLGLIELIKHWYIINLYYDWYVNITAAYGIFAAAAVAVAAVGIFAGAYFMPWSECDKYEYYLGLAIRLMLLIWLFAMADNINAVFSSDKGIAAAVAVIILSVVIAVFRWLINKKT